MLIILHSFILYGSWPSVGTHYLTCYAPIYRTQWSYHFASTAFIATASFNCPLHSAPVNFSYMQQFQICCSQFCPLSSLNWLQLRILKGLGCFDHKCSVLCYTRSLSNYHPHSHHQLPWSDPRTATRWIASLPTQRCPWSYPLTVVHPHSCQPNLQHRVTLLIGFFWTGITAYHKMILAHGESRILCPLNTIGI